MGYAWQLPAAPRRPRNSHLQVKPSHKIHVWQFSQNGVECGCLVAVMGSIWQLRGLHGSYGLHVVTFQQAPHRPHNSHIDPVTNTFTP